MKKKINLLLIILAALIVLTACNGTKNTTYQLADLDPIDYSHPSGYAVTLPGDWTYTTGEQGGVYLISQSGGVACNIYPEIGGMDYYSAQEQEDRIQDLLSGFLQDVQLYKTLNKVSSIEGSRVLFTAQTDAGESVYIEASYLAPLDGVHYYLLFSCGGEDYTAYQDVFSEITKSFRLAKISDEIYSIFNLDDTAYQDLMAAGLTPIN